MKAISPFQNWIENELCCHLGQVVAKNTFFPEPVVLLDKILDSLRPSDVSFDKNLKVEIIKKCKELNSTSLKNNITPAVSMDVENSTYLSVCHGKKHYAAQLNRFIVMFIKETCLMDWGCCDRKINCIHKSIAMWFFKQTEQLSRPWRSQTIEVNQTDTCELMTRTCESSFYPPMDE